ncbi:hypothetical protein KM043_001620 [Ampulex compressa]|nr:hypothetical protein KM043_001620 [Ampulex compressa]
MPAGVGAGIGEKEGGGGERVERELGYITNWMAANREWESAAERAAARGFTESAEGFFARDESGRTEGQCREPVESPAANVYVGSKEDSRSR